MRLRAVPSLTSFLCAMSERCQMSSLCRPPLQEFHKAAFTCLAFDMLCWGGDATFIGHRVHENCKLLTLADISSTEIATLHMHTFLLCHSLGNVSLPPNLREIRAEAFVGCRALCSLVLPGNLRYIGHRAFGECTALSCLTYCRCKRVAWRRPYAAYNAFEECYKLATPWWLHYLPPNGSDWMVPPSHHT